MRLKQGQGKKRHGLSVDRWSVPSFSTSNVSVYALLDAQRKKSYGAYTDRVIDIPPPHHSPSHFGVLHGFKDSAAFGKHLFDLATENFGYPIRVFLARLTSALAKDRAGLAEVVAGNVAKYEAAAARIASRLRDVLRVRGYFATVYAVGCLAIRFKVLPFTEDELLAAILSCHRDHIAFVDNEVAGGPSWTKEAAGAQAVVAAGSPLKPVAGAVVGAATPFDRLRRYINRYSKGGFIDLRKPGLTRIRFKLLKLRARRSKGACALVYVGEHDGGEGVLVSGGSVRGDRRGASEASALKKDVHRRGLLETTRRGNNRISYVVKRPLPDGSRPFFVVIRHNAKKSTGVSGSQRQRPCRSPPKRDQRAAVARRGPSGSPGSPAQSRPTESQTEPRPRRIHCTSR